MKKRIIVTGGSGKAGRAVVADLLRRDYEVVNFDTVAPTGRACAFLNADLTDFGQTVECLAGAWGAVHLAAIPAPGLLPRKKTFRTKTLSTFNVFQAAILHRLHRVVWASSETTLGLPFDRVKPSVAPVDEPVIHILNPVNYFPKFWEKPWPAS